MSPDPESPKSAVFRHEEDDRDMLESLKGLSIKGFHDCSHETPNANTPSSTNASLPTPPALKSSHVFLASPEPPFGHAWYSEGRSIPPNAPLMKDLDSFTDGTGQGSFDFPLATGADETPLPLIFHPTDEYDDMEEDVASPATATIPNLLALELLPSPSNPTDVVLAWIEGVSANTTTPVATTSTPELPPKKRRRSFTQDNDTDERRTRAWSPTIESSHPHAESQEGEPYPFTRAEPEAPG